MSDIPACVTTPSTVMRQPIWGLPDSMGAPPDTSRKPTLPREHGKFLGRVNSVKDQLTPEGIKQQLAGFVSSAAGEMAIARSQQLAEQHRAAEEAALAAGLAAVNAPGDTATELRNTRAVDAAVRQAEKVPPAERIGKAATILAGTNREQLGAVAEALVSTGVSRDVVESPVVQQVPEVAAQVKRVQQACKEETVLRHNAARLREHVRDGRRMTVSLVDPSNVA